MNHSNKKIIPRTRFGEPTSGNCVTFTIDGEETFKLMYEKFIQAKSCIYIANYDLDPRLRFVRGEEEPSSKLNSASNNFIRSPCRSDESTDHREQKFSKDEKNPLQDLLKKKQIKEWRSKLLYGSQGLSLE